MKDLNKALLIIVAFFVFYAIFGVYNYLEYHKVNNTNDFYFHWDKINGRNPSEDYPSGFHTIFQVFSENEFTFYLSVLILICVLIPVGLYFVTKTSWVVALYFCAVSLPHMFLYGATYPQALTIFWVILYLCNRKKWTWFIVMAVFASLTHRSGALLCLAIGLAEIIEWVLKKYFPKNKVLAVGYLMGSTINTPATLIYLLVIQISLPLWYFARTIYKNPFYALLVVIGLAQSTKDARTMSIMQLALIIVASREIKKTKSKWIYLWLIIFTMWYLIEFAFGTWKYIAFNI